MCENNSSANIEVNREEGGEDIPGAEIPLQLMEVHVGPDIHLQPAGICGYPPPTLEQGDA